MISTTHYFSTQQYHSY